MGGAGFVEAWRHHHPEEREFSWYRHDGSGFRIDHAFVSPPLLPRVAGCHYSHEARLACASDHSLLILDIADA
jgi:exodeoxyribonuclease III